VPSFPHMPRTPDREMAQEFGLESPFEIQPVSFAY